MSLERGSAMLGIDDERQTGIGVYGCFEEFRLWLITQDSDQYRRVNHHQRGSPCSS
jgi:hypothetical protein